MKTGLCVLLVLVLLMSSSCSLLTNADVYILNNSAYQVKISVKKTEVIPKQQVTLEAGADHNFTVGAGNIGTFKFIHTAPISVKVKIADGQQVLLSDQYGGPGIVGFTQPAGDMIFGPI